MKYTWLVEKYLEGELRGEELRDFELEILRNPDIAKEVEEIRKLHVFSREQIQKKFTDNLLEDDALVSPVIEETSRSGMDDLKIQKLSHDDTDLLNFKKKVKSVSLEYRVRVNGKNKIILNKKIFWGAAAVIALLLGLSMTAILLNNRTGDPQAIYSEYYEPYNYSKEIRTIKESSRDVFDLGRDAYCNANYGLALDYFNQVEAGSPSYSTTFLFKGICFMETDQFDKAVQSFNQLSENRVLNEYGEWYRGLCYLRLNKPEMARIEFENIVQKDGHYSEQARSVLKRL